jgi:Tfp pilus assembly protein PilX
MNGRKKNQSKDEKGSVLLMALFVLIILSLLGFVLITSSNTESSVAINGLWAEGAFNAAEAGVHTGIDQLSANPTTSIVAVPVTNIGDSYSYRSGRRTDTAPQPLQFIRTQSEAGYSLENGTGYNSAGYAFLIYQINATGAGPLNAQREVEVQAEYGPTSK